MARMRSLKPEYWHDRKLARTVSRDARMLYMGLWNQADEWGRANADPRVVLGQVFPYEDDLAEADIERLLKELAGAGRIVIYDVDGDPFLFIPTLARHQRLEPSKVPSRHPAPPAELADGTDPQAPDQQVHAAPEPDRSGAQTGSAPDTRGIRAKHVAGSREHVDTSGRGPDPSEPTFDNFYAAYPRKEARRAAEKAWTSAIKRASPQTIVDGLRRHRFPTEKRFVPLPATWLNADRWADGQSTSTSAGEPTARSFTRAELEEILGPDSWQVPEPPRELDPEVNGAAYRAWCREQTDAHRAERVRQAEAALARQR